MVNQCECCGGKWEGWDRLTNVSGFRYEAKNPTGCRDVELVLCAECCLALAGDITGYAVVQTAMRAVQGPEHCNGEYSTERDRWETHINNKANESIVMYLGFAMDDITIERHKAREAGNET